MNYYDHLRDFAYYLKTEEKSRATTQKYMRDVRTFLTFLGTNELTKEQTLAYKEKITAEYAPASVNSMLVALNCFLSFIDRADCKVRQLKIQRQIFAREDKELTEKEYARLLKAAEGTRISLVIQTICGTGIRVSELSYITAEAVRLGKAVVNCKNKTRVIFIPVPIQKLLKEYMKKSGITAGTVFITKGGKPLDRSNIWKEMKALCKKAGVSDKKVFPHNLRHLFARTFYRIEKDIVRLADLLGHSSLSTTRIYTMDCGNSHLRSMERVCLRLTT